MQDPPRCPYQACSQHRDPDENFYRRHGSYRAACRSYLIKRYRCKTCLRTFSDQTFRGDRYDKKPYLNHLVFALITSGVGFRQGSRETGLSRRCYTLKARKLARLAQQLDDNLQVRARRLMEARGYPTAVRLQMDELHSYETCRFSRPVVVANVIERRTRFQIASEVAQIRPSGKMTPRRIRQIKRDEARFGPRLDESPRACIAAFKKAATLFVTSIVTTIRTDERAAYPGFIRKAFGTRRVDHRTTPGSAPRGFGTPLHPINLKEAIDRDHMGRLRRRSWLTSKLREHLQLFADAQRAKRNWAVARFNRDRMSPGQMLGFAPRMLRKSELYKWRQDWGQRSPCPFGDGRRSLLDLHWNQVTKGGQVRVCA
jgi:transposase-like protein